MSGALMKIEGLDKYFGGLHAVNSVSFEVPRGTIKAVIGPNGAGKTTMFNMIAGYFPPSSGSVFFNDQLITGMKPYQAASAGLLRTFQNLKVCGNLSVIDNVLLGRHTKGRAGFAAGMFATRSSRIEEKRAVDEVMPLLDWLGLTPKKDTAVAGLSFGEQRAVELARALAPDPLMLLLDEPAAGLNMHETEVLAGRISELRGQGRTVLLVEHDMGLVMDISDQVVVLNFGEKIAEGIPSDIQNNEDVIRIYLGGGHA